MTNNGSFSLNLLNLFIGLSQGNLFLKPYSKEFKVFGYSFFGIEKDLKEPNIKPECILVSQKIENTLLFEWTQANYDKKKDQLELYLSTTPEQLYLADIPLKAAKVFNLFYIVDAKKIDQYKNDFILDALEMSLFAFNNDNLQLEAIYNRLSSEKVKTFFDNVMKFDRIPQLISIDFEHPDHDTLKENIVIKFTEKVVKSDIKKIIASEIAQEIYGEKFWKLLGKDKQRFLINKVCSVVSELVNHRDLKKVFIGKKHKTDTSWELKNTDQLEKIKVAKKIHDITNMIKKGGRYQLDLTYDHFITI